MNKANDEHDLSSQWQSFSISSEEEKLTNKLNQTHLVNRNNLFTVPTRPENPITTTTTTTTNTTSQSKDPSDLVQQWGNSTTTNDQEDEGWGKGPPGYTAISQGTYFGFNSIIETPAVASMSTNNNSQPSQSGAFSRFKDTPVSFTSAAAAYQQEQNK